MVRMAQLRQGLVRGNPQPQVRERTLQRALCGRTLRIVLAEIRLRFGMIFNEIAEASDTLCTLILKNRCISYYF